MFSEVGEMLVLKLEMSLGTGTGTGMRSLGGQSSNDRLHDVKVRPVVE
jgi:hypothetical protein